MANTNFPISLVIGGAVAGSVGAAFKDVEGRIGKLKKKGDDAKVLQSIVGETIRLREEMRKADAAGSANARGLRSQYDRNLKSLREQGIAVDKLEKHYRSLGRTARSADLQLKGHQQIEAGKQGLKGTATQMAVGTAAVAVPAKISADYNAIIRDIAIKSGIAGKPQEQQMSQTIVQTSRDTGMARNDVADLANQLVGAGMDLTKAMEYAPVAAKFAIGQGSAGTDTAKMINALGQNAKITDPKIMQQALEAIAYQGQAGSFEAADMAKWFPELLANMAGMGITGMDAVTQLGAILQVQMKSAGSSDEAANNLKNWIGKIGASDTVDSYKKAGIDYEKSMRTGLQSGKSTLEASFALAQRYVEKTDPKKAKEMAAAAEKINKETDPAKAKLMMDALNDSLKTGDIFADMQVKAALQAYTQNKALYDELKAGAGNSKGILDKNLAERRDTSLQKWTEAKQAADDAMRSVGDSLRPVTDAVADTITQVAQGLSKLSTESPNLVMGLGAVVTGVFALTKGLAAFKIGKGILNIARGKMAGLGDKDGKEVQKVFVTNQSDTDGDGKPDSGDDDKGKKGKAAKALDVVATGLKFLGAKSPDEAEEADAAEGVEGDDKPDADKKAGKKPVGLADMGLKAVEAFRGFVDSKGEDDDDGAKDDSPGAAAGGDKPDGVQKVFIVNGDALGGSAGAGPGVPGTDRRQGRGQGAEGGPNGPGGPGAGNNASGQRQSRSARRRARRARRRAGDLTPAGSPAPAAGSAGSAGAPPPVVRPVVPPVPPVPPVPVPPMPEPDAAPRAGLMSRVAQGAGRVTDVVKRVPFASLIDGGLQVMDTLQGDGEDEEKAEGLGGAAGSMAGGWAGAAAGAAIGSVVPVIGTAIGGLIGGFLGSQGGEILGSKLGGMVLSAFKGEDDAEAEKLAEPPAVASEAPVAVSEGKAPAMPVTEGESPAPTAVAPVVSVEAPAATPAPVVPVTVAGTPVAPSAEPAAAPVAPAAPVVAVEPVAAAAPVLVNNAPAPRPAVVVAPASGPVPLPLPLPAPAVSAPPVVVSAPVTRNERLTPPADTPVVLAGQAPAPGAPLPVPATPAAPMPRQAPVPASVVRMPVPVPAPSALARPTPSPVPADLDQAKQLMGEFQKAAQAQAQAAAKPAERKESAKAEPASLAQTFQISMPINVSGDVKDPQELVRKMEPFMRQLMDRVNRETSNRQLFDAPHL